MRGRSRGQGLVEFALAVPIVLLLVLALVDFGRVMYAQNAITNASREGARAGSISAAYTQTQYNAIRSRTLSVPTGTDLVAANITGAAGACSTADTVSPTTCFYPDGIVSGQRVVVNIAVTVPLITPVISAVVGGQINLTARSVVRIQ